MAAEPKYTLYHFPMSYYSQRVYLALFEKKREFKTVYVDLQTHEQLEEWYYKIHPDGRVPLLQDGDRFIPESDDIIDYLDKQHPETCLVPSTDTDRGKDVARWRSQLTSEIPIEDISYGVFYNPELSVTGLKLPMPSSKQYFDASMAKEAQIVKDLAAKNPDLKSAVDRKLRMKAAKKAVMDDIEQVKALLSDLQLVFDNVDDKLRESGDDGWICGTDYSAADIALTTLLNRLVFLGIEPLFLTDKRPLVAKYWEKVQARPNMKEMRQFIQKTMQEHFAKQKK